MRITSNERPKPAKSSSVRSDKSCREPRISATKGVTEMRNAWIIAGVYAFVLSVIAVYRWHILTFDADTGLFAQEILDAGHGFRNAPEGGSHFRFHFSPILALLFPLVALTHSALVLQFAQIALIALAAPATFLLFRPYLSARMCTCLAALSLLYAPIAVVGETEFHELSFFPVLIIMLLWAADRERWGWFALFGAGCILTKEDVGIELTLIAFGIALLVWLRRRTTPREGLLFGSPRSPGTTSTAFASFGVVCALVVLGYFTTAHAIFGGWVPDLFSGNRLRGSGWETGQTYNYPFARGAFAVLALLVTHPLTTFPLVYNVHKLTYVLEGIIPLVLLPLRSLWSLAAFPAFAILLLANNPYEWNMGRHYSAMWAPWLLIATGVALAHIERKRGGKVALRWAYGAIAACVVVLAAFNPMHLGYYLRPFYRDVSSAQAALACVPRGASVSTHKEWYSTVAAWNAATTFNAADGVDYLVYASDFNDFFEGPTMSALAQSLKARRYVEICKFGNVTAYKRVAHES